MIITRTPLRISFVGGGSDLPAFYCEEPGCVVSATIDKYITIAASPKYDGDVRVSYSRTENVRMARQVEHPLVCAALHLANIRSGIEVVSIGDIPVGTGLGSSSAFTVGLLAALYAQQGEFHTADGLAHDACRVEIELAHSPIGKQDQYAVAYGGLRRYIFQADGSVTAEALAAPVEIRAALEQHLLLFDTGRRHEAGTILAAQGRAMLDHQKRTDVRAMANLAHAFRDALLSGDLVECGEILDAAWRFKRNVVSGITSDAIDGWYAAAKRAGALGGKLCGAGGGGFLLIYAPPDRHGAVVRALGLRHVPFKLVERGCTVVYAT